MKQCTTCKQFLPLELFANNKIKKDGKHNQCKPCKKIYNKSYYPKTKQIYAESRAQRRDQHRKDNQEAMLAYLMDKSCVDCGMSDMRVLEFDHVRGVKNFNIGNAISQQSWSIIEQEIEKCEIVCANCHRIRTAQRGGWYRYNSLGET